MEQILRTLASSGALLSYHLLQLILVILLLSMAYSELKRTRAKDYSHLVSAFSFLLAKDIMLSVVYALDVFFTMRPPLPHVPVLAEALENFSFVLLGSIIVNRIFKFQKYSLRKWTSVYFFSVTAYAIFVQQLRMAQLSVSSLSFVYLWTDIIFEIANSIIIAAILVLCFLHREKVAHFYHKAFLVFALAHLSNIANLILLAVGEVPSTLLYILSNALPVISYIFLTLAVYSWILEEIHAKSQLLEKMNKLKTDFLAVVSHELKTPLSSMKISYDMLLNRNLGNLSEDQKQLLQLLKKNSERLIRLINELLDVSRIEAGKYIIQLSAIQLNKLIQDVVVEFQSTVGTNLEFRLDFKDKEINLFADEDKIKQLFTNLIQNSYKFTPDGGKVSIETRKIRKEVTVVFSDNGRGIAEDKLEHIFDSFYQEGESSDREVGGLGLGLSIVKHIVEAHQGNIEAWSKPEQGTKIRFSISTELSPEIQKKHFLSKDLARYLKETVKK